jgi:hypothetical protein
MQLFLINPNKPERPLRKLANAVEALLNIFYLLEREGEDPEKLRQYLRVSRPVMASLKEHLFQQYEHSKKRRTRGNTKAGGRMRKF